MQRECQYLSVTTASKKSLRIVCKKPSKKRTRHIIMTPGEHHNS